MRKSKSSSPTTVVIGMFYGLPKGRVWRSIGGGPEGVYGYDQYGKSVAFSQAECEAMLKEGKIVPLDHVRDFPSAEDPRLPYVFDLHWDAKTVQALRREMAYDAKQAAAMLECLREHVPKDQADLSGKTIPWAKVAAFFRAENDKAYEQYVRVWGTPQKSVFKNPHHRADAYDEDGLGY